MPYKGSAKSQHVIHSSSEFKRIQRQKNLLQESIKAEKLTVFFKNEK
jgi:hypothetical protein